MQQRLRVLVTAYACDPTRGSESAVGWGWSTAIARYHDLWIIAGEYCRETVEAELARRPELQPHMRFFFIRQKQLQWLERLWPPLEMLTYQFQWQREAYRLGRQLHREVQFDLHHQLTYVGWRAPGYLWKLDIPFVWGPIGGIENTPWRLLPAMGAGGIAYYTARNMANGLQRTLARTPRLAFGRAAAIIAATSPVRKEIRRYCGRESFVIPEIGLPNAVAPSYSQRMQGEPLRLVWSGQHTSSKALHLLLEVLRHCSIASSWNLTVLGAGPRTKAWQRKARQLGIADCCRWTGWIARDEALAVMRRAHVMVITSLKDLSSTVTVEALAQGLPVVCPDHCGFSDVVTGNCGIKIPIPTVSAFQQGLKAALQRLAADEALRQRLARGALARATEFSWEKKAAQVDEIYRSVVGRHREEPTFSSTLSSTGTR